MKYKKETTQIQIKGAKNTFYKILMLYKTINNVIKFYDDYSSMVSETKHKVIKGIRLKILTPEQMLQRLPISLTQVRVGNNS